MRKEKEITLVGRFLPRRERPFEILGDHHPNGFFKKAQLTTRHGLGKPRIRSAKDRGGHPFKEKTAFLRRGGGRNTHRGHPEIFKVSLAEETARGIYRGGNHNAVGEKERKETPRKRPARKNRWKKCCRPARGRNGTTESKEKSTKRGKETAPNHGVSVGGGCPGPDFLEKLREKKTGGNLFGSSQKKKFTKQGVRKGPREKRVVKREWRSPLWTHEGP